MAAAAGRGTAGGDRSAGGRAAQTWHGGPPPKRAPPRRRPRRRFRPRPVPPGAARRRGEAAPCRPVLLRRAPLRSARRGAARRFAWPADDGGRCAVRYSCGCRRADRRRPVPRCEPLRLQGPPEARRRCPEPAGSAEPPPGGRPGARPAASGAAPRGARGPAALRHLPAGARRRAAPPPWPACRTISPACWRR